LLTCATDLKTSEKLTLTIRHTGAVTANCANSCKVLAKYADARVDTDFHSGHKVNFKLFDAS